MSSGLKRSETAISVILLGESQHYVENRKTSENILTDDFTFTCNV